MKKINFKILGLILPLFLTSCEKDEVDTSVDVVTLDKVSKTEFDEYLDHYYTKPYNVRFVYKWDDKSSDHDYQLVPVNYENAVKMANLVKYLCLDAYQEVAPKDFLKKYFPKNITLIGSAGYRNNGTMILGLADSGVKITLFDINNLNTNNVEVLYDRYFRTIYHEFSHILHQTKDYTKDFRVISEKDYVGDSWNEAWKGSESSLSKGFISDYSSKEPNEDFVELIAHYVTFTPQKWDETLEKAGAEGKEKLQQKIEIVKNYMNTVWKIDLDRLRNEVLSRATNLDNVDLDKIKIK